MRRLVTVLVLASAVSPAGADSASDVLRSIGFEGTWAMDCTKNIGTLTVSIPAAGDPLVLSATPVSEITSRIVAAERLAINTVRLVNEITDIVLKNPKAPSLRIGDAGEGVWERIEQGFKLQQSRFKDVVTVRDGRFVPAGTPTPLLTKCPTS